MSPADQTPSDPVDRNAEQIFTRDNLYQQVWSKPLLVLAAELGLSDVGLSKICQRLKIPRPGVGYWAKVQVGQRVRKKPLPAVPMGFPSEFRSRRFLRGKGPQPDPQIVSERQPEYRIIVADELVRPHRLIAYTHDRLLRGTPSANGILKPWSGEGCDVDVSEGNLDRAMRILDALFKAIEARGWTITAAAVPPDDPEELRKWSSRYGQPPRTTAVIIRDERIPFTLMETDEWDRVYYQMRPIPASIERHLDGERPPTVPMPIRRLFIQFDITGELRRRRTKKTWSDKRDLPLDVQLNRICIGLVRIAEKMKRVRQERLERAKREREEEARRREAERQRYIEQIRLADLNARLHAFSKFIVTELLMSEIRSATTTITEPKRVAETLAWLDWIAGHQLPPEARTKHRAAALDHIPPLAWTKPLVKSQYP